jgi:S1-C subfamily serine protease
MISTVKKKVLINKVLKDSIAEAAGIKNGDRVMEAAGVIIHDTATLVSIIQRQAPGTWLPLIIDRKGTKLVIIAKFAAE